MTLPNQLAPASGSTDPDDSNAASAGGSGSSSDSKVEPSANPPSANSELAPMPVAPVASSPGSSGSTAGAPSTSEAPPPESPASSEPLLSPPSVPSAAEQCADGLLDAAQSSCYLVATVRATWQVAWADCSTWGGALVKVESAEEDQLMGQLVTEDMWLGASDTAFENVFVWTDGSPIVFGNWGPAQPDRFPGPDCIQKRSTDARQWFDQPCGNQWLYVCEKPIQR